MCNSLPNITRYILVVRGTPRCTEQFVWTENRRACISKYISSTGQKAASHSGHCISVYVRWESVLINLRWCSTSSVWVCECRWLMHICAFWQTPNNHPRDAMRLSCVWCVVVLHVIVKIIILLDALLLASYDARSVSAFDVCLTYMHLRLCAILT